MSSRASILRRARTFASGFTIVCLIVTPKFASADSLFLGNSEIEDVSFQFFRGGKLFYLDSSRRIEQVPVEDIGRLKFDELPRLDDAERALSRGDLDDALDELLASMARAQSDVQRTWLHARLAGVHDRLGDFLEAASNAAAVWTSDSNPAWARLAPTCDVNKPTWYSAAESRYHLLRAQRAADDTELSLVVAELLAIVEPLYAAQREQNPRREYRDGSTVSGILLRDLTGGWPGHNRTQRPAAHETEDTSPAAPPRNLPPASPDAPEAIDAAIERGEFDAALRILDRLSDNPGDRDLAQYLFQYGVALAGADRPREAAVRFMQCAAHFPGSRWQALSVIETAVIYRDVWKKPETARRLAERALETGAALGDEAIVERAEELVSSLESGDG